MENIETRGYSVESTPPPNYLSELCYLAMAEFCVLQMTSKTVMETSLSQGTSGKIFAKMQFAVIVWARCTIAGAWRRYVVYR